MLSESLHIFELLHSWPLIERFLIIKAYLLEGLSQIEQSRFALNQGKYEVAVFFLISIPKSNIDLSKALRNPTCIGKHLEIFRSIRPLRICFLSGNKIRNHRIVHLILELSASFEVLFPHIRVSLTPLLEIWLEDVFYSHILIIFLTISKKLSQNCKLLLSLSNLNAVAIGQADEFTLEIILLSMLFY